MTNTFSIHIYRVTEPQIAPGTSYMNTNNVESVEGYEVTEEQYFRFCSAVFKFIAVHGIKTPIEFDYVLEKHNTYSPEYGSRPAKYGYINVGKFYATHSNKQEMLLKNMNKMVKDVLGF